MPAQDFLDSVHMIQPWCLFSFQLFLIARHEVFPQAYQSQGRKGDEVQGVRLSLLQGPLCSCPLQETTVTTKMLPKSGVDLTAESAMKLPHSSPLERGALEIPKHPLPVSSPWAPARRPRHPASFLYAPPLLAGLGLRLEAGSGISPGKRSDASTSLPLWKKAWPLRQGKLFLHSSVIAPGCCIPMFTPLTLCTYTWLRVCWKVLCVFQNALLGFPCSLVPRGPHVYFQWHQSLK